MLPFFFSLEEKKEKSWKKDKDDNNKELASCGLERKIAAKLSECIAGLVSSSAVTACFTGYHSRMRQLVRRIDPGAPGPAVSISQSSTQGDWQSRDKTTIILYYPRLFSQAALVRS